MPRIPDKLEDKYEKVVVNYKQIRRKLKALSTNIPSNTSTQNTVAIVDILNDMRQMLKTMNGIHRDDDTD